MPLRNDKMLLGLTMLRHDRLESSNSSDTVGFQEDIYNGSGSTGPFDTNFRPIIADGTSVVYNGERKIIDRALVVLVDGVEQLEAVDYDSYRSIGRVEFRRVVPPTALVKVQYYYEITGDDDKDVMGDQDIWGLDLGWRLSDDLNVSMDLAHSRRRGPTRAVGDVRPVDWTSGGYIRSRVPERRFHVQLSRHSRLPAQGGA